MKNYNIYYNTESIFIFSSAARPCKSAGIEPSDIYYIGIDNEGESVMMWDKDSGEPVYNAIVWQDRRTAEEAGIIFEQRGGEIYYKTGLRVDAYYSATKIKWIIDNVPGVQHKIDHNKILVGTMDSWLIWKMTNGQVHITDSSTASRTMLINALLRPACPATSESDIPASFLKAFSFFPSTMFSSAKIKTFPSLLKLFNN